MEKRSYPNLQADTNKSMQICTDSLVGNSSLWSVTSNVSSLFFGTVKADAKYLFRGKNEE
jgi:hypothetical protein